MQLVLLSQEARTSTRGAPEETTKINSVETACTCRHALKVMKTQVKSLTNPLCLINFLSLPYKSFGPSKVSIIAQPGSIDDMPVVILLECGASPNVIRPGIATKVLRSRRGQLKRLDGSLTSAAELATVGARVHTKEG